MAESARPEGTFSIALSLTGGVSTGAYLAGALDFIIEALDAFQDAQAGRDAQAPPHAVLVEAICGASSGALTGGVAASVLRYAFDPANLGADAAKLAANPLYDAWVNMTGAAELLGTRDRGQPGLRSLFDSTSLDRVTEKAITFGLGRAERSRNWVADPLRICFSVTNLEGVPFSLSTNGGATAPWAVTHVDVLRFNVCGLGSGQAGNSADDESKLFFPANPALGRSPDWKAFGQAAVASAAFPVVLAARSITRKRADYSNVQVVTPAGKGQPAIALPIAPSFAPTRHPNEVTFTAVDGGIVDNSPVDLARAALNHRDVLASNERGGSATKAVVTIDPMLVETQLHRRPPPSLEFLANVGPLLSALIDQARFRPQEVALAQDKNVFSRFIIAPTRDGGATHGGNHLAGASCHAFGGYLAKALREHDFFLGRCNAQAYLASQLTLPATNPIFECWRASSHHDAWVERYSNEQGELPIIPLIGRLHPRECAIPLPIWPKDAVDLEHIGNLLEGRLDLVHGRLQAAWRPDGPFEFVAKWLQFLFWGLLRRKIRAGIVRHLDGQLRASGLSSAMDERIDQRASNGT